MIDKDTIRFIQTQMTQREIVEVMDDHGRSHQIVVDRDANGEIKTKDLADYQDYPAPYINANREFYDIESFCDYVGKFATENTVGFIYPLNDDNILTITKVIFDYHESETITGRCAHVAHLTSKISNDLSAVLSLGKMSQDVFCEFIEDNLHLFAEPSGAAMLEVAQKFRATQNAQFGRLVNTENGDVDLTFKRETHVDESIKVPSQIKIRAALLPNGEPQTFMGRFQYNLREGNLTFRIKLPGIQQLFDVAHNDIKAQLEKAAEIPFWLSVE